MKMVEIPEQNSNLIIKPEKHSYIDVDITDMTPEERHKVKFDYKGRQGFIDFSTGYENQHTTQEKMVYTFWFENKEDTVTDHPISEDKTLEVLEQLFFIEYDELIKVRGNIQGNGELSGKIFKEE